MDAELQKIYEKLSGMEREIDGPLPGYRAHEVASTMEATEMAFQCLICPRELKSDTCPPCAIQHR